MNASDPGSAPTAPTSAPSELPTPANVTEPASVNATDSATNVTNPAAVPTSLPTAIQTGSTGANITAGGAELGQDSQNKTNNGGPAFDPDGARNVGNGAARQFIGGQCLGAADCASGCCAGPAGICSGPQAATQDGKTGCGFEVSKRFIFLT